MYKIRTLIKNNWHEIKLIKIIPSNINNIYRTVDNMFTVYYVGSCLIMPILGIETNKQVFADKYYNLFYL